MMYQVRPTNKQNFFGRNYLKILIMFFVVVLPIFILSISDSTSSLVSGAFSPFLKTGNSFFGGLRSIPKFFSDKKELMEENQALLEEMENNRVLQVDYESLKYENQKLREDLNLKPSGNFTGALVLARSPQIPLDSVLIDKGYEDGLKNGDLVLAGERTLIGKIAKISKNRATVILNSFAGAISYGYVARTEEPIDIEGDGGGNIQARVPIDFDITQGDKIIVGGSASFIAAVVGMIEEDSSSGFKEVFMSLPVDISKTNVVFVEPFINEQE